MELYGHPSEELANEGIARVFVSGTQTGHN
jgi:hypothetical protein